MILHLVSREAWEAAPTDRPYTPASYATEGYIHCTAGDGLMLQVANRLYRDQPGEYLALSIDETRLSVPVQWEPTQVAGVPGVEPPPEAVAEYGRPVEAQEPIRFPHIYGPIDRSAIVAVRRLVRTPDGSFIGYAPLEMKTSSPASTLAPVTPQPPKPAGAADPQNPLNLKSPSQMADELLKATDDFSEALARFKDSVEARIEQIDQDIENKL